MSVFVRRTLTTGPPPDLAFGEMAYSDGDQVLHVGRAEAETPPTSFPANPTDYSAAIAALEAAQTAQGTALAAIPNYAPAIALLDAAQAALATDVDALETIQGNQAAAIAAINADLTAQGNAIAEMDSFSGDYNDLTNRPTIPFGFTYDQTAEPVTPAAGQTWRERSGAGLIVGDWEWSGSLWMGADSKSVVLADLSNARPFRLPHLAFGAVVFSSGTLTYRAGVTDGANYLSSLDFGVKLGNSNAAAVNTVIYNFSDSIRSFGSNQGINITVSNNVYLAPLINTTSLGISSPSTVGTYNPVGIGLCLRYREVRP